MRNKEVKNKMQTKMLQEIDAIEEPCNCGEHIRHNNGGNYHKMYKLYIYDGDYYILETNSRERFPSDNSVLVYSPMFKELIIDSAERHDPDEILDYRKTDDIIKKITIEEWKTLKKQFSL